MMNGRLDKGWTLPRNPWSDIVPILEDNNPRLKRPISLTLMSNQMRWEQICRAKLDIVNFFFQKEIFKWFWEYKKRLKMARYLSKIQFTMTIHGSVASRASVKNF